ncbi:MAG: SHOCT domain-containing protein [Oscillospiraceae bacterium]|nr:SHOCT domain-containing protein [Oscillospiraceae bacterium]MBQ8923118.1 SHOCT domain-containing protein [Oscillospiraceae bacterium]
MLFTSKKCVLILNENGISGEKKSLFGKKSVELPFENITSIAVQNGLIDKLIDGQTVSIASATGFIRFRSVMNAQEFTDKTLVELRKFKEMTRQGAGSAAPAAAPAPAPAPAAADETDKLLKLKSLLDNGVISQEEYEEKRKELLARL